MSATALSLPQGPDLEATDFLRRLAAMMKGGRNSEMLLEAANMIESLTERATSAEQAHQDVREQNERNLDLRNIAEIASDRLLAEAEALREQLADEAMQAEAERERIGHERERIEHERARLEEDARQLSARADDAEAELAKVTAELDELRKSLDAEIAVTVPIQAHALRLARAQFDFLAEGFARTGDVISLTICEIGSCAIDRALAID